jgi:hypothetical protein
VVRILAILLAVLGYSSGSAVAGTLEITEIQLQGGERTYISISDEIELGDWTKFFRLVRRTPSISGIILNSPGGSVDDGLAIAKYVYGHKLDTVAAGPCDSICAIIFLSGENRFLTPQGALSFHSAYRKLDDWVSIDHQTNGKIACYLGHMGYPLPLAQLWISTPVDQVAPITAQMNADLQLGFVAVDTVTKDEQLIAAKP